MKKLEKKLRVGILGGTGMVGQRFITLLEGHPWFEVTTIAASSRSAGKTYEEAMSGRWKLEDKMPEAVKNIVVKDVKDIEEISNSVDFVFSAVDMTKEEIKAIEDEYAKSETPVVSNNSAHRWTEDVPMVVPEINIDHFDIIETQKKRLGTKRGFVAVKPNCSIQGYVPALAAWKEFEPYEVCVTTYQAISGAGKNFSDWPEMVGNIIPYIGGEEEKSEKEPLKIFGEVKDGKIVPTDSMNLSAQCIRVPVLDGHLACVSFNLENNPGLETLVEKIKNHVPEISKYELPLAPTPFIKYYEENDRPQPVLDRDNEKGMQITVGRLREDNLFDYKFVGLSHNTLRGAAGGAVLTAELIKKLGYLD